MAIENKKKVRIYTRTGDKGFTSLTSGQRLSKSHIRIESYGHVDELNALIGLCHQGALKQAEGLYPSLLDWLQAIQHDLFILGSDLATPVEDRWEGMVLLENQDILCLEKMIDHCESELLPLTEFVLPGGSSLNAYLHLARTVCRRAERCVVELSLQEEINPSGIAYLNRLSDLLFVLSRWVLAKENISEVTWKKSQGIRSLKF